MYFELIGFFALVITAMFVFAEMTKKASLGIIASVLIFVLGAWMLSDGIQIRSGEITSKNITSNTTSDLLSNLTTTNETDNETYVWSPIQVSPFMPFNTVVGLVFVLLSIYGGLFYVMQLGIWK